MHWFFILSEKNMKCSEKSDLKSISEILTIISQENRLQIICLLNKEGELCVCKITEILNLKQNLASHHLNLLKNIGLLNTRREGKNIFYELDKTTYKKLQKNLKNIFSL